MSLLVLLAAASGAAATGTAQDLPAQPTDVRYWADDHDYDLLGRSLDISGSTMALTSSRDGYASFHIGPDLTSDTGLPELYRLSVDEYDFEGPVVTRVHNETAVFSYADTVVVIVGRGPGTNWTESLVHAANGPALSGAPFDDASVVVAVHGDTVAIVSDQTPDSDSVTVEFFRLGVDRRHALAYTLVLARDNSPVFAADMWGDMLVLGRPTANLGAGALTVCVQNGAGEWSVSKGTLWDGIEGEETHLGFSVRMSESVVVASAPSARGDGGVVYIFDHTLRRICDRDGAHGFAGGRFGHAVALETVDDLTYIAISAPPVNTIYVMRLSGDPTALSDADCYDWHFVVRRGPDLSWDAFEEQPGFGDSLALGSGLLYIGSPLEKLDDLPEEDIFYAQGNFYAAVLCRPNEINRNFALSGYCLPCDPGTINEGGFATRCEECSSTIPVNATFTDGCEYECDGGFFGADCVLCSEFEPEPLPDNAFWLDGAPECDWYCEPDYSLGPARTCTPCPAMPANATRDELNSCEWSCVPTRFGDDCAVCSDAADEVVGSPPGNSSWIDGVDDCLWRCDNGFFLNPNATDVAVVDFGAPPPSGEWGNTTCLECTGLPADALWSGPECEYTCRVGFFGAECVLCSALHANESAALPEGGEWVDGAEDCCWECASGLEAFPSADVSAVPFCQAQDPAPGAPDMFVRFYCCDADAVPDNAIVGLVCDYECLPTFFGDQCEPCSVFGPVAFPDLVLPDNAVWVDGEETCGWGCRDGFVRENSTCCVAPPENAFLVGDGECGYDCTLTYFPDSAEEDFGCVSCSDSLIAATTPLPEGGFWVDNAADCRWWCGSGYHISFEGSTCCSGPQKPAHAYYDSEDVCKWHCEPQYRRNGDTCEACSSIAAPTPHSEWVWVAQDVCALQCQDGYEMLLSGECELAPCYEHRSCGSCVSQQFCGWCSTGQCINTVFPSQICPRISIDTCPFSSVLIFGTVAGAVGSMFCCLVCCIMMRKRRTTRSDVELQAIDHRENARLRRAIVESLPTYTITEGDLPGATPGGDLGATADGTKEGENLGATADGAKEAPPSSTSLGTSNGERAVPPSAIESPPPIEAIAAGGSKPKISDESCSICLGEYGVGDVIRILPCAHNFHVDCIDHWLGVSRQFACPLCRHNLMPGDTHSRAGDDDDVDDGGGGGGGGRGARDIEAPPSVRSHHHVRVSLSSSNAPSTEDQSAALIAHERPAPYARAGPFVPPSNADAQAGHHAPGGRVPTTEDIGEARGSAWGADDDESNGD